MYTVLSTSIYYIVHFSVIANILNRPDFVLITVSLTKTLRVLLTGPARPGEGRDGLQNFPKGTDLTEIPIEWMRDNEYSLVVASYTCY